GVPAGDLGDLAARILAQRLSENGHPAIVENRLGGNGIIATDAVAKSRADGYTLIMGNHSTLAILPHITKIGYDPEKDLAPIALMLAAPNVAIVRSALPVTSMRDLVAYGKANRLTNATQGIGASGHLIGEQFKQVTGVDLVHVHYRGGALALQDVVAGHVDMMFDVGAHARARSVRTSAGAGGVVATAEPGAARCPDLGGSRVRSAPRRRLVRADGARRHAARDHRLAQRRDPQGVRSAGGAPAPEQAGASTAARKPGRVRRVDCRREQALGRGDPHRRHQTRGQLSGKLAIAIALTRHCSAHEIEILSTHGRATSRGSTLAPPAICGCDGSKPWRSARFKTSERATTKASFRVVARRSATLKKASPK